MKRELALLLALAMTVSMLPVNAFASSSNTVNKSVTVKDDDMIEDVYLKIVPKDEITTHGESLVLDFENAYVPKDNEEIYDNAGRLIGNYHLPNYAALQQGGSKDYEFDKLYADASQAGLTSSTVGNIIMDAIDHAAQVSNDNYLPWKLRRASSTEIEVYLFPVTPDFADMNVGNIKSTKPNFYIPLYVQADGEGDVKVTIDPNTAAVSATTTTIAVSTSDSGATTTTVDEVEDFNELSPELSITIKETVAGTFEKGSYTLRLNNGFVFHNAADGSDITIEEGTNLRDGQLIVTNKKVEDDKITFDVDFAEGVVPTKNPSSIVISGLKVEPEDEDDDWGAVNLTVKGAGITSETVQIANRVDYGMSLKANEDPTSILTGFTYVEDNRNGNADDKLNNHVGDDDLDEDDFVTAEVHLEETIADTWDLRQKLYFKLPEGVKIINFETDNLRRMNSDVFTNAYLDDNGSTLIIPRLKNDDKAVINDSDVTEFDIKFYVTIDPAFGDNDITLEVYGAGVDEGVLQPVVIAKAVTPISITTQTTTTNIGYTSVPTADITITENVAGAILDDEDILVSLDTLWTQGDIGFYDDDIEVTAVGNELEIDPVKTNGGEIRIPVTGSSYTAPGSIEITGVQVGTSRSVPYGDFDLNVNGRAVINNYRDISSNYKTSTCPANGEYEKATGTNPDESFVYTQDNTEYYSFKNYLSVGTSTGTLDSVVSVTIGETTITVDGQAYTMDVAPYIQASSDSTLVPLRFVSLALGVDSEAVESVDAADASDSVTFDPVTKTATIYYAEGTNRTVIAFTAGSNVMKVNGAEVPMNYGVTAEITDSRMFVPFRALGTALGVKVTWDDATRTATYNG